MAKLGEHAEEQPGRVAENDPRSASGDFLGTEAHQPGDLCCHLVGLNVEVEAGSVGADVLEADGRERARVLEVGELRIVLVVAGLVSSAAAQKSPVAGNVSLGASMTTSRNRIRRMDTVNRRSGLPRSGWSGRAA